MTKADYFVRSKNPFGFFHHSVLSINNRRKEIKEIILPDNFLIHIFAITLEM